jgi:HAD superfamily hydrolase (TIGR01549 family)
MTKIIIFDYWGTLMENGVWSPIKQVRNMLQINLPFPEYVVRMERAMMTEKTATLKDAFTNVFKEFGIPLNEEILQELVGMWNKNWMLAKPFEETIAVLNDLKQDYKLVLVSNTDAFSLPNTIEKHQLSDYFEREFLSFETHMIKTDKNFFKHVIDELQVAVEDCVMVGDSLQSDVLSAQKIGMTAILVDRRDSRNYKPKINNLKEIRSILNDCIKN